MVNTFLVPDHDIIILCYGRMIIWYFVSALQTFWANSTVATTHSGIWCFLPTISTVVSQPMNQSCDNSKDERINYVRQEIRSVLQKSTPFCRAGGRWLHWPFPLLVDMWVATSDGCLASSSWNSWPLTVAPIIKSFTLRYRDFVS